MTQRTALQSAIEKAGGQAALAERIGVTQSLISFWLNSAKRGAAPEHVPAIEAATGISRHDLRPDVFGPAPKSEQAA